MYICDKTMAPLTKKTGIEHNSLLNKTDAWDQTKVNCDQSKTG